MDMENLTDDELGLIASAPFWSERYNSDRKYAAEAELRRRYLDATRRGVKVGDTIDFIRHGRPPEDGYSRNHRDGTEEDGVSVYLIDGSEVVYVGWYFGIAQRPAYRGRGTVVGFGSDGEPLVRIKSLRRAKRYDRGQS